MKGGGRGGVRYGKPTNLQLLHAVLSRICIIICVIYGFASEFWFGLVCPSVIFGRLKFSTSLEKLKFIVWGSS